jgi:hypothetical protein
MGSNGLSRASQSLGSVPFYIHFDEMRRENFFPFH